jgi:hypothetical protein
MAGATDVGRTVEQYGINLEPVIAFMGFSTFWAA